MKRTSKLLGLSLAAAIFLPIGQSNAQFIMFNGYDRDYATDYCEYYKTRAAFAKQRERKGIRSKYRNKTAHSLRAQYIACLKKYATPNTYIPRK